MATASSIITRALRIAGVVDAIETPSAAELSAGLDSLNDVLAGLSLYRLAFYAQTTQSITLTPGDGAYTIATGADFSTPRPLRIESAYITINGIDSPLLIGNRLDFNALATKTTSGAPITLYYDATFASGDLRFYPVPDAAYVVTLTSWKEFTRYTSANESVTLPNYLIAFLHFALAIDLAPQFQRAVEPYWVAQKDELLDNMRTLHKQPVRAQFDISTGTPYNIETG
jgi:hypothetical protein